MGEIDRQVSLWLVLMSNLSDGWLEVREHREVFHVAG